MSSTQVTTVSTKGQRVNFSEQPKPCNFVWEMCDTHPEAKRSEVIAFCVSLGIAYFTARTQYQAWRASKSQS